MKYFLLSFVLVSLSSFAQVTTTINFDDPAKWNSGGAASGYGTHVYDDGLFAMTSNKLFRETSVLQDGFPGFNGVYALRLRNEVDAWTRFKIASGGVSTFSMNIRRWDGTPDPNFYLQYSTNGGTDWTQVAVINNASLNNQSGYQSFSGTINSNAANILIEVSNVGLAFSERVMIDDFVWTDFSSPSTLCGITAADLTALTCNDATTGSDPADDFLSFSLNPTGANLGANGYTVSVSSGTITPAVGTYGAATAFQLQAGSAGAGDVVITITDADSTSCSLTANVIDPGACSSATPVITLTPASLTGFNHVVGTPSAEQTFTASGLGLTADIEINAPTNFQISLTTGTGFTNMLTLPQTAGVVVATTIYTRANAAALGTLTGNIIATSTGADNDTVMVSGSADDYVSYMVEDINSLDANGVADSLNVLVSVTGVIQCGDYDYNAGYSFALVDGNGDGINIFRTSDLPNYTSPMAGDSIIVRGKILQFNGLTEIQADSIQLAGTGTEADFMAVTTLSEATESMPIEIMGLTLVTPIATFTAGANIDATDGTNTISIRIPSNSPLGGTAAPQGLFNITGIGWQFDSSSPYTTGYQIYPCGFEDVCTTPSNATTLVNANTASATATGVDYQWINCATNAEILGATNQTYTALLSGNYAVIVTDGDCSDTSACVSLVGTSIGIEENSLTNFVSVYPNPVNDVLTINSTSDAALNYTILDVNGKVMTEATTLVSSLTVSTINWNQGVYFVRFSSENGEAVLRVIK